jgi:hypothetical protein
MSRGNTRRIWLVEKMHGLAGVIWVAGEDTQWVRDSSLSLCTITPFIEVQQKKTQLHPYRKPNSQVGKAPSDRSEFPKIQPLRPTPLAQQRSKNNNNNIKTQAKETTRSRHKKPIHCHVYVTIKLLILTPLLVK